MSRAVKLRRHVTSRNSASSSRSRKRSPRGRVPLQPKISVLCRKEPARSQPATFFRSLSTPNAGEVHAPGGHSAMHTPQLVQTSASIDGYPSTEMAPLGHACAHRLHCRGAAHLSDRSRGRAS